MQVLSEQDSRWINSILEALEKSDIATVMSNVSAQSISAKMLPYKFHLMGLSAIRIGNFTEALSLFKQASDAKPEAKIHFEACGYCAAKLGMLSDSLYYMKLSSTCDEPSSIDQSLLPSWLGTLEAQVANIEERPFFLEAQATFATGNFQKTLEHLQQALNADPFNVDSWLLIYETMLMLDRKFDAVQAVKAANDSGEVSAKILYDCAFYAAQLGLHEDVENLISLAEHKEISANVSIMKLNILEFKKATYREYFDRKNEWIQSTIPNQSNEVELPFLEKKIRLGIYSSRLNLNFGTDPIVNFLIDICNSEFLPWMSLYIYSDANFMDVNTRRLASVAYEFRSVNEIDSLTLSRIMKNDGLHFLWDLDGFVFGGKPEIHGEISIPFRWTSRLNAEKCFELESLNQSENFNLRAFPFSLPVSFSVTDLGNVKVNEVKRFAVPFYPYQITDGFLSIFVDLKKKHSNFVLVLDTKKMGGVSYVEQVENMFEIHGLQNYVEFVEPYKNLSDYQNALFEKSDYILIPEGHDALQLSYIALLHSCRAIILSGDIGPINSKSNFGNLVAGLDVCYSNKAALITSLSEEFKNEDKFLGRLTAQSKLIEKFNSSEERNKRILEFGGLLKGCIENLYGEAASSILFSEEGYK